MEVCETAVFFAPRSAQARLRRMCHDVPECNRSRLLFDVKNYENMSLLDDAKDLASPTMPSMPLHGKR